MANLPMPPHGPIVELRKSALGGAGGLPEVVTRPEWVQWFERVRQLQVSVSGGSILADGSVAMAANLPMDGNVLSGLGAGAGNGQSLRYEQLFGVVSAAELGYLAGVTSGIQTQLAAAAPPGLVSAYGGTSAPTGWLLCDGSAVSRTTYAALFTAIGITHGQGDGSTTFNVPDYEGRFLRGRDNAAGRDPGAAGRTAMGTGGATGDAVGSVQAEDTLSHTHTLVYLTGGTAAGGGHIAVEGGPSGTYQTGATGGNETRPLNAYVNFIIKT